MARYFIGKRTSNVNEAVRGLYIEVSIYRLEWRGLRIEVRGGDEERIWKS